MPKTAETAGLIGRELLAKAKPGLRLVNAARGGIVDEEALAKAIASGIAGAALDVFATEPPGRHCWTLTRSCVTPHLGASTREAQDKAGLTIAEQVVLALDGELVPFAVNLPATEATRSSGPSSPSPNSWAASFPSSRGPPEPRGRVPGPLANHDTRLLTLAALKGLLLGDGRAGLLRERSPAGHGTRTGGTQDPPPPRTSTSTW